MKLQKSVCFIYKTYHAIYNNKKDTALNILNYISQNLYQKVLIIICPKDT